MKLHILKARCEEQKENLPFALTCHLYVLAKTQNSTAAYREGKPVLRYQMAGPYSPKSVANALLQRSFNKKQTITHLKLQKLVFLAHGYYLAMSERPLINEPFEAWDYGPVCRGIYQEFRDTGREPINRLATDIDWDSGAEIPVPAPAGDARFDRIADFVVQTYGDASPFALSDLSHKEGWAWDKTRKEDIFGLRNKDIANELIKNDFAPLIKKRQS